MSDQRQNNQLVLAFVGEGRSEAANGLGEGTEIACGEARDRNPGESLMEEVCERAGESGG